MSKERKKFKDTTMGQLLLGVASTVNPTLGKILEGVTSPKDAIAEITKSDISSEDKIKLQQMIYDQQIKEMEAVTSRWQADMASDNTLSKSVRPLTLIFVMVSTVVLIFIDSGFINFAVDDEWKSLLNLLLVTIVAAYFGGRSYEKGKSIKK
jgi:cation transport ATPase